MKTNDPGNVCPYPGLRSFTEEESIYFKGRDSQVDQISALLEQNKFLMVTGASGEGKSSLIYGGLIPNVRAGFFKARFSNWVVASFRPEREPLKNLSAALAEQFGISQVSAETELKRGYSSLIDLYTNSRFYPDGTNLDKKESQRQSANLLILADQFEEFFTNPENYFNDAASTEAQVVVNLLLETARISIKRKLPVYVVCTMRSDYIGQCAAFRGLPEYIGFSQFFVPRLKRKDLKQVIEEPAILSGNSISQRLIERLVFDLADGVDQLPILQHALSQIWLAADKGREEMDLIHYAFVGGMPPADLPDADLLRFKKWFNNLPEKHRNLYTETGLDRVIDIHASLLFDNATAYYNRSYPGRPLTESEIKNIIRTTFSGLTKIDNGRAVRNRMTLTEIAGIVNQDQVTPPLVGRVINLFREEGNSFIYPFKTADPATHELQPDTVLDITHESLIRNWGMLNRWANVEFESYSTWLDFKKQLDRWTQSGKKSDYLLPIGPLIFFENWYDKVKPGKAWIMRYAAPEDVAAGRAESDAKLDLENSTQFLKRSARSEIFRKTFLKYGARRIGTVLAILIMLLLTGFYWYDADQKKNDNVINAIRNESRELLSSQQVNLNDKAIHMLAEERFQAGAIVPYLSSIDKKQAQSLAIEIYGTLAAVDKHDTSALKQQVFDIAVGLLNENEGKQKPEFYLAELNKLMIYASMDEYYNPDNSRKTSVVSLANKAGKLVLQFFRNKELFKPAFTPTLNLSLQYWLTFAIPDSASIRQMLNAISPKESSEAKSIFDLYYAQGSFEQSGRASHDFSGGYHTLASLYAAAGEINNVEWCFNQLLQNKQRDYFELPRIFNNHVNIVGYLYQYGHRSQVPQLLKWFQINTADNPPVTILRNAVIRSGYITHLYQINYNRETFRAFRGNIFPNLYFCDRSQFDQMMEDHENEIQKIQNPDEREFTLAMNDKRKVAFYSKYWYDRQIPVDSGRLDKYMASAISHYRKVSDGYLDQDESTNYVYNSDGVRTKNIRRKELFIYPDYRDGFFAWFYHSDYIFDYLHRTGQLNEMFKTGDDLEMLHLWVAKAFENKPSIAQSAYTNPYPMSDSILKEVIRFVDTHPAGAGFDRNLILLVLSNRAFDRGDSNEGIRYYSRVDHSILNRSLEKYEYLEKIFVLNQLREVAANLVIVGQTTEAVKIAENTQGFDEKAYTYISMAEKLYSSTNDPTTFVFADSAIKNDSKSFHMLAVGGLDSRVPLIRLLSTIGSRKLNERAVFILKDIADEDKMGGILARIRGVAIEGNYYRAHISIPPLLTESQDLRCRTMILLEVCRAREAAARDHHWKMLDERLLHSSNYINYIPV